MSKAFWAAAVLAGVILSASQTGAAATLTNATLYDVDSTGTNLDTAGAQVGHGGWTTVLDQQNVPGNYGGELFLATTPTPTPSQFLTPQSSTAISLAPGANTIYFWADSDDTLGGTYGFGLNLFLDGAAATSPSISALAIPGAGAAAVADTSAGCTAGYNFACTPAAGTLTAGTVSLTNFQVFARGGGTGGQDLVNSTNTAPFTPPPHADGINDTYGVLTLNFSPAAVPEPASWALMLMGFGGMGIAIRSSRKQSRACA